MSVAKRKHTPILCRRVAGVGPGHRRRRQSGRLEAAAASSARPSSLVSFFLVWRVVEKKFWRRVGRTARRDSTGDVRPASRMASATRRAKKEIELQSRKRDSEKKKAEYMKGIGGGLKYTAIAMAERAGAGLA